MGEKLSFPEEFPEKQKSVPEIQKELNLLKTEVAPDLKETDSESRILGYPESWPERSLDAQKKLEKLNTTQEILTEGGHISESSLETYRRVVSRRKNFLERFEVAQENKKGKEYRRLIRLFRDEFRKNLRENVAFGLTLSLFTEDQKEEFFQKYQTKEFQESALKNTKEYQLVRSFLVKLAQTSPDKASLKIDKFLSQRKNLEAEEKELFRSALVSFYEHARGASIDAYVENVVSLSQRAENGEQISENEWKNSLRRVIFESSDPRARGLRDFISHEELRKEMKYGQPLSNSFENKLLENNIPPQEVEKMTAFLQNAGIPFPSSEWISVRDGAVRINSFVQTFDGSFVDIDIYMLWDGEKYVYKFLHENADLFSEGREFRSPEQLKRRIELAKYNKLMDRVAKDTGQIWDIDEDVRDKVLAEFLKEYFEFPLPPQERRESFFLEKILTPMADFARERKEKMGNVFLDFFCESRENLKIIPRPILFDRLRRFQKSEKLTV